MNVPEATACVIKVPEFSEILFSLSAATSQELLLYKVARLRGLEAGIFRYGEKVTSRE